MDSRKARIVADAIIRCLNNRNDNDYPELKGITISDSGGSFGIGLLKMKLSVIEPVDINIQSTSSVDDNKVKMGLATNGTPVSCSIRGGHIQHGIVVEAKRVRYVILGKGGKYDGKEFTYPFTCTSYEGNK